MSVFEHARGYTILQKLRIKIGESNTDFNDPENSNVRPPRKTTLSHHSKQMACKANCWAIASHL